MRTSSHPAGPAFAAVGLTVAPEAQLAVLAATVVAGVVAESAWERQRRAAADR